ncbi:MAG TPA: MmgE/PrpD family protein [Conexibacter sp.]|jgi:2-methylcitrate dehydratase PrpD|nr:MmgE/PrpD family protein [Conexibacter sp.]
MTSSDPLSRRLAAFATNLTFEQIPGHVVEAAKLHLLDLVGTALAAYGSGAGTYAARASLELGGSGEASVIGQADGSPAAVAALANGTLAHAIEFDDTHTASICHISAVVVPAALAVAEAGERPGHELLAAIVAGNEVVARIGADAAPAYMRTGFHPTSVCGVFGATVAAARLRRLTENQTTHALGIAGSLAGGLFEYLGDGAATKSVHGGWAAHGGVSAAALAAAGGDGPAGVLEGRFGLYATHFRLEQRDRLGEDWELGTRWETPEISFKPYPACHFIAGALDAARTLLAAGLDVAAVEEVVVAVPQAAVPLVLEPRASKLRPRTPFEAKFSLPYSLASMLLHGSLDVATYRPERLLEERVLALAGRIQHEVEDFPHYPDVLPARVTVCLRDGGRVSELSPAGAVAPPFTSEDVRRKFRENAALALGEADRAELEARLLAIDEAHDLRMALGPLRRAR